MKFEFVIKYHATPLLTGLSLLVLSGCGTTRSDQPVYVASEEIQAIEVPEGMSQPTYRPVFEIPGYSLPELAAQGDESLPPDVPSSAEAEQAQSRIRFGPTGLYLEVEDEAASVWRRLSYALNRGEMSVEKVLEDQRRFVVKFDHEPVPGSDRGLISTAFMFWKAPDLIDYRGRYLLEVQRATAQTTRVAILDEQGGVLPMQQAEFVLNRLQDRLG